MSRKNIITGTLILTCANLITKCMGFFYRVFMSNAIGAEGMGLYQLILPLYMLAWSITSAGFTTTISHLAAQEYIRGQNGNIGRIVKQAVCLSLCASAAVSCVLFFGADSIALSMLRDRRAAFSLRLLALAVPFMAASSCFRGFFLGIQETLVPAFSQVLEQTVRILTIYFLAGIFVPRGLSYACGAAVCGILFGELLSCGFTVWNYFHYKRKHKFIRKPTLSSPAVLAMILSTALPLSASRIAGSLLSTVENLLIPRQLQLHGQNTVQALSTYGELTGMAMPLVLLPSACLMAASVSLVPEISEACAVKQDTRISKTVSATFLFTSVIGFGAAALFAVFPHEICYIVYDRAALGQVLFPLAFLCPLLYAQTTLHGLLNGLGEQLFLFRNNTFLLHQHCRHLVLHACLWRGGVSGRLVSQPAVFRQLLPAPPLEAHRRSALLSQLLSQAHACRCRRRADNKILYPHFCPIQAAVPRLALRHGGSVSPVSFSARLSG